MARPQTIRDVLLLSSFLCTVVFGLILIILLYHFPYLIQSSIMDGIPDEWQQVLKAFRLVEIICCGIGLVFSSITFLGSFCRSARTLKIGLRLLVAVIILEIAFCIYMYLEDPTGEKTSQRIWLNMSQTQRSTLMNDLGCSSEPTCRARIRDVFTDGINRDYIMGLGIGLALFQVVTLIVGTKVRNSLKFKGGAPLPYTYPYRV